MSFQDTKEEMMRRYRNSRLMQNYLDNKEKQQNPIGNVVGLGKNLYDGFKSINSVQQPSAEFMGKVGASLPQGASFSTPASGIEGLGSTSLNTQAIPTNTIGQGASQAGQGMAQSAGSALGKAMPVVGTAMGGLSAANNFKNGNYTDGALDLAKTGAMFIPGVGWAVAGAIQIGQMIKNMFAKKQQEAIQKSQQENAKAQQQAQQDYAQQKAGIDELQMENAQNMQQQLDKQNQDTMEQNGIAQQQPQDLKQDIYNQVFAPQYGQVTGGAAPIPVLQASQPIDENAAPLPYEGSAQQALDEQAALKQSLMDKFKSGISDFAAGYKDNTNSTLTTGDLAKKFQEAPAPTQNEDGTFIASADDTKKSIMARLGELAGTGQRIAAHPLTQAAIAGAISKAAGGDIDDIATAAYKYGTAKADADRYYQQVTGNVNRPFLNTYSYKDATNKLMQDRFAQQQKQYEESRQDKLNQQDWERDYKVNKDERDYNYKVNKDKEDRIIKRDEIAARKKYWETRGRNDRATAANVAQQKYDYQQGLNKSLGQFSRYVSNLEKAKEGASGWFANTQQKEALAKAQEEYDKAKDWMVQNYGGDFVKYAKEQGWE